MTKSRKRARVAAKKAKARRKAASRIQLAAAERNPLPHNFVAELKSLIRQHHELYDKSPVTSVGLEELISKALLKANEANTWRPGSHQVSTDITLDVTQKTLSVKSGDLSTRKATLKLSGSRLGGKKSSLTSMLNHVNYPALKGQACKSLG